MARAKFSAQVAKVHGDSWTERNRPRSPVEDEGGSTSDRRVRSSGWIITGLGGVARNWRERCNQRCIAGRVSPGAWLLQRAAQARGVSQSHGMAGGQRGAGAPRGRAAHDRLVASTTNLTPSYPSLYARPWINIQRRISKASCSSFTTTGAL